MRNTNTYTKKSNLLKSPAIWTAVTWIMAIIVGIALRWGWMPAIDIPLLTWIKDNQIDGLQNFMYVITLFGYWQAYVFVLGALALILIAKNQLRTWIVLAVSAVTTFAMNELLKAIFQRERPFEFFQMEQDGLSYPSGHAMVGVAVYFLCALMLVKAFPNLKLLAVALAIFSFLPGLSRLFMGVHYPVDVIMGWLLGLSSAIFWYRVWLQLRSAEEQRAAPEAGPRS